MWDARCGSRPRAVLGAVRCGGSPGLCCLALSPDGQLLHAGADSGHVHAWDLRGGRQAAAAFGGPGQVSHPMVVTHCIATLLRAVPVLCDEVEMHASAVTGLCADPGDGRRLGVGTARGCSLLLDTALGRLTHAHVPPPAWEPHPGEAAAPQRARWPRRRALAWAGRGGTLAAGGTQCGALHLHLLDFSPAPTLAGCHTHRPACPPGCGRNGGFCAPCRRSHALPIAQPLTALCAHPTSDEIVATAAGGRLVVLTRQRHGEEEEAGGAG